MIYELNDEEALLIVSCITVCMRGLKDAPDWVKEKKLATAKKIQAKFVVRPELITF